MKQPKENFLAYIDESGDEGFTFGVENRSSEWLVLSAVVTRIENDPRLVEVMRNCRRSIGRPDDYTVHFRNLNHHQRLAVVAEIAKAPIRTVSVICQKPLLDSTEYLREKYRLYFYLVRFLLERVSWICRAHRPEIHLSSALTKVVFSNRSAMSYDEIRSYLVQLRGSTDTEINWDAIHPDRITALPHRQRAGLQIADAVASSHYYAFEKSGYGFTEDRYARILLPSAFKRKQSASVLGFGIKIFPKQALVAVRDAGLHDWIPGMK